MQVTEQLSRQAYSQHCQTFKVERFAKRMSECSHIARNFQARGSFIELSHFDKHLIKNASKKGLTGNIVEFLS